MELLLLAPIGFVLFVAGHRGIMAYARAFTGNPRAAMSADLFVSLLGGPGAVPVLLCASAMVAGVSLVAVLVYFGIAALSHFASI